MRGILNKLASLSPEERALGVIAASAGNHAVALAYGATLEGIDSLVVMWKDASPFKRAAAEAYGAEIDQEAAGPHEVFDRLAELQQLTGRIVVDPWDDPLVMSGQGTVGLEIAEDLEDLDVVVVPVGGGGLISGIASALPGTRFVAVEPERASGLHDALVAGRPVESRADSIADGLNAPFVGERALAVCQEAGVESHLVTEEEIEDGFRFLYERAKLAAEPAGAVGVAALLTGRVPDVEGKTVAVVVTGGNVATQTAAAILNRNEA